MPFRSMAGGSSRSMAGRRRIAGMQDKVVHDFMGVDIEMVWTVVHRDGICRSSPWRSEGYLTSTEAMRDRPDEVARRRLGLEARLARARLGVP